MPSSAMGWHSSAGSQTSTRHGHSTALHPKRSIGTGSSDSKGHTVPLDSHGDAALAMAPIWTRAKKSSRWVRTPSSARLSRTTVDRESVVSRDPRKGSRFEFGNPKTLAGVLLPGQEQPHGPRQRRFEGRRDSQALAARVADNLPADGGADAGSHGARALTARVTMTQRPWRGFVPSAESGSSRVWDPPRGGRTRCTGRFALASLARRAQLLRGSARAAVSARRALPPSRLGRTAERHRSRSWRLITASRPMPRRSTASWSASSRKYVPRTPTRPSTDARAGPKRCGHPTFGLPRGGTSALAVR